MKLTKGEFSLFSINGQKKLIEEKGIGLLSIRLDDQFIVKLILVYDFYVEAFCDCKTNQISKINLAVINVPVIYFEKDL